MRCIAIQYLRSTCMVNIAYAGGLRLYVDNSNTRAMKSVSLACCDGCELPGLDKRLLKELPCNSMQPWA